jgi:uncharacterized protein YbjT (DUF2867 family)
MRVTVFGATGGIGSEVVRQGLAAGHDVVAVVRDPARLTVPAGPGLGVVTADVMDLTAMADTGVRRLVAVSASGAFIEPSDPFVTRVIAKPLLQRILRDSMADTRRMEGEIWASAADWTLMRPPQLTNRPGRGRYRRMIDSNVGRSIARADVADAILAALADPATIGHTVGIGY